MKLLKLNNKNSWEEFVRSQPRSQFLQSWEWGEFNADLGCQVRRFGVIEENNNLVAVAAIIEKTLPGGWKYWYSPRGPIVNFEFRISNFESIFNF